MIPVNISKDRWDKEIMYQEKEDVHETILQMILNERWRDVIEHLTEDMDPWDIDLTLLNERFMRYLEELKSKDLKIPAKMILIAALIYRMKSEFFKNEEEMENEILPEEEKIEINQEMLNKLLDKEKEKEVKVIDLPPILLPIKKPIKRRVTLYELIDALDKALRSRRRSIKDEEFSFDLNEFDIREFIEKTYEKIIEMFSIDKVALFSKLLERNDAYEKIITLQSLLHLSNEERIRCIQEEPFSEIKIYPPNEGENDV